MNAKKAGTPPPQDITPNVAVNAVEFKFRYVFYTIGFILLVMSIYSYSPEDTQLWLGGAPPIKSYLNWVGPCGACIAHYSYLFFGLAVWPILILCLVSIIRPFFAPPVCRRGYIPALLLVILGTTVLFALHPERFMGDSFLWPNIATLGLGHSDAPERALSGGVIGQVLAAPPVAQMDIHAGVLRAAIGEVGTQVSALIIILAGLFVIFLCDWKTIVFNWLNSGATHKKEEEVQEPDIMISNPVTPPTKNNPIEKLVPPGEPPPPPPPPKEIEKEDAPLIQTSPSPDVVTPESETTDEPKALFNVPRRNPVKPNKDEAVTPLVPKFPAAPVEEDEGRPATPHVPTPVVIPAPTPMPTPTLPPIPSPSTPPTPPPQIRKKPPTATDDVAPFVLPPISMLTKHEVQQQDCSDKVEEQKVILCNTLSSFGVEAQVTNVIVGPRVIRYELAIEQGILVSKVQKLENNLKYDLAVENIRVIAPIPGKSAIGVEVPNPHPVYVFLRQIMETSGWTQSANEIPIVLGRDIGGKPLVTDLARMPHLLVAGATGMGKSVCVNTLIMSLIYKFTPDELRLILVDPKVVEMEIYSKLPHLITPVVNDSGKIPLALRWAVNEMERRYKIMAKCLVKNLRTFNQRPPNPGEVDNNGDPIPATMPYLVIIVDEFADVMMTDAKKDVEQAVARIAQKGRAAGIHLVLATQRPSANIITGVIKANLPTRIAFRVGSDLDSRIILNKSGAEQLLGGGDMIFLAPGGINLERIQGAYVEDANIASVTKFVSDQRDQRFLDEVVADPEEDDEDAKPAKGSKASSPVSQKFKDDDDDLPYTESNPILEKYLLPADPPEVRQSLEILYQYRKISTSFIQRQLGIGYNRAADIMDIFERRGIIGPQKEGGSKRDILIFDELKQDS